MLEDRALPSAVSFAAPVGYALGNVPSSEVIADFNGDGKLDLLLLNGFNTVSVLLGNGDGTFQTARNSTAEFYPSSVALGDFNRDGKLDLAVSNAYGGISTQLGNGDGTFQAPQYLYGYSLPSVVAVGDFNGDATPDLAEADAYDLRVALSNGDGTFPFQPWNISGALDTWGITLAVADFNGDGKPDLAVGTRSDVSVWLGKGDGSFQRAPQYSAVPHPGIVAAGDFNGDGKPDLAVGGGYIGVFVALGNGDGTFQTAQNLPSAGGGAVAVADFNGDGKPDLVVTDNYVRVLLGNGDGTFQTALYFPAGFAAGFVAAGDFNGDGRPDLAVIGGSSTVSVLMNQQFMSASAVSVSATAGAPFNGPVATFVNPFPSANAASYTATIDWGDGSTSAGAITGAGTLTVSGSHTYADPGIDAITVVINGNPVFPATATVYPTANVTSLGQDVQRGLAGDIGFWHGSSGQALINSFNGGPGATALSTWLAQNFSNLYGNLWGSTNADVAAFYQSQFALSGPNAQAQVLATALNVYATTQSLGGTAGQAYGFTVTDAGLGADSFNAGSDGDAFGFANNSSHTVYAFLKAVDRDPWSIFSSDSLRKEVNDLFDALNKAGRI
jgi:VCBS repeat protein